MNFADWIKSTKKIIQEYDEGAIFAEEAFNAILANADETKPDADEKALRKFYHNGQEKD